MVAVAGEAILPDPALRRLANTMSVHPVGRSILREKPTMTQSMLTSQRFKDNTLGERMLDQCERSNITLDTRRPVKFQNDEQLAYILTRYRQVHDFLHLILDQETNYLGESTVKAFEAVQTKGLPMTVLGGTLAPYSKLTSKRLKEFTEIRLPWALKTAWNAPNVYNLYWENLLHEDIDKIRKNLNITILPRKKQ